MRFANQIMNIVNILITLSIVGILLSFIISIIRNYFNKGEDPFKPLNYIKGIFVLLLISSITSFGTMMLLTKTNTPKIVQEKKIENIFIDQNTGKKRSYDEIIKKEREDFINLLNKNKK